MQNYFCLFSKCYVAIVVDSSSMQLLFLICCDQNDFESEEKETPSDDESSSPFMLSSCSSDLIWSSNSRSVCVVWEVWLALSLLL